MSIPQTSPGESAIIDLVIEGHLHSLGTFNVRRALPSVRRRHIGPFVFFDHMGPVAFAPGERSDIRPHPHIALATITYLFEGEIVHRDSLGSLASARPGDINWMISGRGIVHSERATPEDHARSHRLHGLQVWVALPLHDEEMAPSFEHHPRASLPVVQRPGAELRVLAGTAYGQTSPVGVRSPTLYVHARLDAGAELEVDDQHEERAIYVVDGQIECDGQHFGQGALVVLRPGARAILRAPAAADLMLLGGAPLDAPRHIYWNFISSSKDRIEQAKDDWRARRFPSIPGDDAEFIPLPES
jgi:hypothetical protein